MARKNVIEFVIKLVDDASKDLQGFQRKFLAFSKSVIKRAGLIATAIGTLSATFFVLYRNMTKSYAEFDRFSQQLGISTEILSQLEYAARQTGVGINTLKGAMENMSPAIDSAVDGVGIAADALKELDLNAKELNKLRMEDQFLVLADAFAKIDNETRALILSQDIFGQEYSEIVRMLQGGSEALKEHAKESDRLGATIRGSAAKEARLFREELGKLELSTRQLHQVIITEIGPALRDLATWLVDVAKAAGELYEKFANHYQLGRTTLPMLQYQYALVQAQMNTFVETVADGDRAIAASMPAYQEMERRLKLIAKATQFYVAEAKKAEGTLAGRDTPTVGGAGVGGTVSPVNVPFPLLTHIPEAKRKGDTRPDWVIELDRQVAASDAVFARLAKQYQEKMQFMESIAEQAARGIQTAMADFFFDPFEEGLDGMLKKFIDVVRRMIAEWLAFQTLNFFGIGNFFTGAVGLGQRASGGHVTAGRPYLVGERGPELFVSGKSGSIMPNNRLGAGGQQFVTNIDARGADPGLIARLPKIMEQRDRLLMLKMKDYMETGSMVI